METVLVLLLVLAFVLALRAITITRTQGRKLNALQLAVDNLRITCARLAEMEGRAAQGLEPSTTLEKKRENTPATSPQSMLPPPLPVPLARENQQIGTPAKPKAPPEITIGPAPEAEPAFAMKATPRPEAQDEVPNRRIPWKSWLRRLHLWPPSGELSGEAGLAGWWTTRAGIVLGVIAVVFLGVYVNRVTAPWIRFVELLAISGGVFTLGWWLQKRWGRFGDIVSSGGLAMLYFTAYAAHGVAAVQITAQPWVGVLLQTAALALMLIWSDRKRDSHLAAAAIGLGYVTCAFAMLHALPLMTLIGIILLGLMGGVLYAGRDWRFPFVLSVAGSYGGLLTFAFTHQDVLPLHELLITAVILLAGFSGALRWRTRSRTAFAWEKRLALVQGSGAVLATVAGAWLVAPHQMEFAYLTLCAVFGIHAWLSWKGRFIPALFSAWFLKASTFLALYVATEFDGPTRWLGLAAQGCAILWTMRQSQGGHRWLGAGFVVLWGVAFVFYGRDAITWRHEIFHLGDPRRIVAWGYLILATLTATLYQQRWWRATEQPQGGDYKLGLIMAILSGAGMILSLSGTNSSLLALGVAVAFAGAMLVMERWRQSFLPLVSGAVVILAGHLRLWTMDLPAVSWWSGAFMAVMLGSAGYLLARQAILSPSAQEAAARLRIAFKITPLWSLCVLTSGLVLGWRAPEFWPESGIFSVAVGLAAAIVVITGSRRLLTESPAPQKTPSWHPYRAVLLGIVGLVFGAYAVLTSSALLTPWILLGAVGLLVGLGQITRDRSALTTIIVPAFLGTWLYLFPRTSPAWPLTEDLCLGLALIVGFTAGAWSIVKARKNSPLRDWIWLDAIMHSASLLVLFQVADRHVAPAVHWLLMSATTASLILAARRLPFPALKWTAWLPAVLVVLSDMQVVHPPVLDLSTALWYWLGAALLIAAWRLQDTQRLLGISLSAAGLTWTALVTLSSAAEIGALAGVGLGYAAVWHWRRETGTPSAAMITGGLALVLAHRFLILADVAGPEPFGFHYVALASLFIAVQGWLLKSAPDGLCFWRDPVRTWVHAAAALSLIQVALLVRAFGLVEIATACWAIASILLFAAGLAGGMRPYRIVGLLGLFACTARVFAVDVQDTFYRIIAFAVMALVLVGIGYLYTRFRPWIESNDPHAKEPAA